MAKRGGFPGGMPGNMNNLMKQAQKMQKQMEENQKALEEKEFTATAGGGAVEVTISGKKEVTKVKISEDAVDPDDVEMLEDLIMAATNEALRKVEDEAAKAMGKLAGGLGSMGARRNRPNGRCRASSPTRTCPFSASCACARHQGIRSARSRRRSSSSPPWPGMRWRRSWSP